MICPLTTVLPLPVHTQAYTTTNTTTVQASSCQLIGAEEDGAQTPSVEITTHACSMYRTAECTDETLSMILHEDRLLLILLLEQASSCQLIEAEKESAQTRGLEITAQNDGPQLCYADSEHLHPGLLQVPVRRPAFLVCAGAVRCTVSRKEARHTCSASSCNGEYPGIVEGWQRTPYAHAQRRGGRHTMGVDDKEREELVDAPLGLNESRVSLQQPHHLPTR